MKRFWTTVDVDDDRGIRLDGKEVRTPARAMLRLPTRALAEAVAAEWDAVGDTLDPRAMPMTGLANAAIDRVGPDPAAFAATLSAYAETDVLCYRAEADTPLAARQGEVWDQILARATRRYDVAFVQTSGITHVQQPAETIARLRAALTALNAFDLAAASPLVTISGSLVLTLLVLDGEMDPHAAFDAAHLDELWQAELWGEDVLAAENRQHRRDDFLAAARFASLLR